MIFAHERQARPEEDRDEKEGVEVDGNQHDFATRKRAAESEACPDDCRRS